MKSNGLVGMFCTAAVVLLAEVSCSDSRPQHPAAANALRVDRRLGVALKNFVQVDTAVSVGDDATEVVVSMVIRVR